MNGYLMKEQTIVRGADNFIESFTPENRFGVVFEDDGDTAYFYAVEKDPSGSDQRILDALHIYEAAEEKADDTPGADDPPAADDTPPGADGSDGSRKKESQLQILWSKDWLKCALIIDAYCHAIFDFKDQGGYNINEFPPPNAFWTKGERKLTDAKIRAFF